MYTICKVQERGGFVSFEWLRHSLTEKVRDCATHSGSGTGAINRHKEASSMRRDERNSIQAWIKGIIVRRMEV